jgi:hypothetical protein
MIQPGMMQVHPDAPRSVLPGQRPGQALHPGLRGDVAGQVHQVDVSADGAEADDRPAAAVTHHRRDGLGGEEVMP